MAASSPAPGEIKVGVEDSGCAPPWEDIHPLHDLTNDVAQSICRYVKQHKLKWKVPCDYLSAVLQREISCPAFTAACIRIKEKHQRLLKNRRHMQAEGFLKETFKLPSTTTTKPKPDCVDNVLQSLGSDVRPEDNYIYKSLLNDYNSLKIENERLNRELVRKNMVCVVNARQKGRPSQEISRQRARVETWKKKYFELKKSVFKTDKHFKRLVDSKQSLRKSQSLNSSLRSYYSKRLKEKQIAELEDVRHDDCIKRETILKERVADLEYELTQCQEKMTESDQFSVITTKEKKTYNAKMRSCIYYALEHQCPVDHVSGIVQFIAEELTGNKLQSAPCPATVSRMAREMGILSDMQTGQVLSRTPNSTVAWDATELSGAHVNEVHIATPNDKNTRDYYTLGFGQLAGGTTSDYTSHIQESLMDTAASYSGWTGENASEVLDKMKSNISASISDRVSVNHCVVQQLKKSGFVNTALVELNCNVHPLDSLASKARSVLKNTGLKGITWGKDCAAVNVLLGLSKLRYKQGKGDPVHFKSFFKGKGIPLKLFPRYVGNRIHVVFHLAGMNVHLKDLMIEFLSKYCAARGGLTASILKDLQNPDIIAHLQILGLFGKLVTGPWMSLFYTESKCNLDMVDHLKICMKGLQSYVDCPGSVMSATTDVFGSQLEEDSVFSSLTKAVLTNESLDTVKLVAAAFIEVCQRQLQYYLTTDFTDEQKHLTRSTPTHNMQSERVLAISDAQVKRAPNAKTDFVEAKVKAKTNRTLHWLKQLSTEEKEQVIHYVVPRSREMAQKNCERRKITEQEIIKRMMDKSKKRDDAERRKVERRVADLEMKETVTVESIEELGVEVPSSAVDTIQTMLSNPLQMVEKACLHTWFDKEKNGNVVYHGTVVKLRKRKKCTFVISYYVDGEDPEECVDEDISRSQLIVDMLFDDLVFI